MQPDGDTQDLGPIRDSNVVATIERPWKVVFQRRHQPCCPFREHWQDVVSALAGARQMVLGNHEEYLVVQTLQFLSPQFRVAFPQPTEGRHLRGQPVFSGLFIQRPNGLESAFVVLEWERNCRAGIPPPRLGTTTFPGGAPCSAGPSRFSSATPGAGVSGTPVLRAAPWTPAVAASLFCGWDSAQGRLPPPRGGSRTVACVEAAAITGGYGGGIMGP